MTRIRTFAALIVVLASPASAQVMDRTGAGATLQGKARGTISEHYLLRDAHAAHRAAASDTLHKLNAVVLRNPAFSPPMGLDIATRLVARTPSYGVSRGSIQYEVAQLFYWYRAVRNNQIVPTTVHSTGFSLYANEIPMVFSGSERWVFDPAKQVYLEPRKIGEASGYPYYNTFRIVVKKTERPIWIPVTRGEAITILLSNAKHVPAEAACLQAALERLTPAERAAAAYISLEPRANRQEDCTMMVDASHRYARGLVKENPEFYDKGLPATALQVIVLDFAGIQYPPRNWHHPVVEKLRAEMDYAALAALIATNR